MEQVNYKVHPKEQTYFWIRVVISLIFYAMIFYVVYNIIVSDAVPREIVILAIYVVFIILYVFFATGILVGHIKGNGVRINEEQFPQIYGILERQCLQLGIKVPPVYMIQNGGVLNAFATKFIGRNYVVLYSEIFDLAFEEGTDELSFIMGHELGHVKRNHITKKLLLFPSVIVPFLAAAYSRACEYTCDGIGKALSPNGATTGLLILAAGKTSHRKVNLKKYLNDYKSETGFWLWLAEKVSTHPNLPKRIKAANNAGSFGL